MATNKSEEPAMSVTSGSVDGGVPNTTTTAERTASASWWQQLEAVLRKNCLLLMRRPLQLVFMILSSAGFVLLATLFVDGKEKDVDFGTVPLTECGTVDPTYLAGLDYNQQEHVPLSYNEAWRNGFAVTLMAFGPMFHAVVVFVILQTEIQTQMLGILRAAGLAESVFWASWWIPFTMTSFVNALVAAITASAVDIHALQHIYFAGVLGSFFFLNLALVGASFFVASLCGTARGGAATWCIILIVMAAWAPYLRQVVQSSWITTPAGVNYAISTPNGLFWMNRETTQYDVSSYLDENGELVVSTSEETCQIPILSEERGKMFVPVEEQDDNTFQDDEMFVGCFFGAGYINAAWNQQDRDLRIGISILFMFPYTHFSAVWGNFLGYTGMPSRTFTSQQAALSPEALALASLPKNNNNSNNNVGGDGDLTMLFPAGSTLNTDFNYYDGYDSSLGQYVYKTNCPPPEQKDYFCSDLSQTCPSAVGRSPTESPSVNALFAYLFVLSIMYTLLAAYWTQVFPGKNGAPRRFYFFLLPSYWLGSRGNESSQSSTVVEGVEINNVRKQYGSNEAVKGVTMKLESGEVTALLGHNGAGKTSLSHILSCEIAPTCGDVSVFGYSVREETDKVRRLVAVCKQDDYLYPDLSAFEHLSLFAGIRGVARGDIPKVVEKWLESVDLSNVQDHYSSSFSGGMKRRLSLACSTIGERPVLILDECTTGMDPISRRFVWRHIDAIKEGKVVLLTTHAMEEADLLADSVAVMRKGNLAAYGTPLELKSQYGSALHFTLLVEKQEARDAEREIKRHFSDFPSFTGIDVGDAGNIAVKISSIANEGKEGVSVEVLTDFVKWLENKDVSGVTEYGFSNSSLEEVFLAVTKAEDEERPVRDELDEFDVCCSGCSRGCTLCCLRSCCRCCCCPRQRVQVNEEDDQAIDAQALGFDGSDISSFAPVLSPWRQTEAVLRFSLARNWLGSGAKASWIFHAFFVGMAFMLAVRGANSGVVAPFIVGPTLFLSFGLVSFVSPIYRDRNNGVFYLMRTQGLLRSGYIGGMGLYAFLIQFLFGLVLLTFVYATGLFGEPEICSVEDLNDFNGYDYCNPSRWSFTRVVEPTRVELLSQGDEVTIYATWQSSGYLKVIGAALAFALTTPGAVFSSAYLPGFKFAIVAVILTVFLASMAPLISYFLLGVGEDRLRCVTDICDIFLVDFNSLTGEKLLNCIGLEVNTNALGSLCMPAHTAILPQFGLFQMLSMAVISNIAFVSNPPEYVSEVLIPALGDDVKCDGNVCQFPYAHSLYGVNMAFTLLGALLLLILGVSLVSFFSFPDGWALRVRQYLSDLYKGVRSLGSHHSTRDESDSKGDSEPFEEVVRESEVVTSFVQNMKKTAPDAVEIENGEVALEELPPVLAHKLHKVYPALGGRPPKVALGSLDLHVPKGQVLGLLGQNGAGKTTAIKILAASHEATSGLALVAGYDVSTESKGVFEHLGNCPQFDVVWPGQSIQRHLEFFARLKGLPRGDVRSIAYSVARAVGLGGAGVYERQAGHLSGGMRRRLSIAIALIGAPSVITLDEPTTGLDPSTRNSIWNLVNSFATPERAIIITTHMMLEADTLCNRIAIMSRGELKVVATQQALKDRFGSGYLLQLNLTKSTLENQTKAIRFVRRRIHEDSVLQSKQAKTLRIALPRDISLTDVFGVLYSNEALEEGCINQFLLSQSSLEDVFITLGD